MKPWAKWFYESRDWHIARINYLKSVFFICNRCGKIAKIVHHKIYLTPQNIYDVNITLNTDNFEALCQDCHNKEHLNNCAKIPKRYVFDVDGNLILK